MGSSSLVGLEGDVARHFDRLSVRGQVLAEYMWVGGTGSDLRSKSRVLNFKPHSVEDLPIGLSIIGAKWQDWEVLKAGAAYERARTATLPTPDFKRWME